MEKHDLKFLKESIECLVANQTKFGVVNNEYRINDSKLLLEISELNDYFKSGKSDDFYSAGAKIKTSDGSKAKILKIEEVTYFIEDEDGYAYYVTGAQIEKRSNVLKTA